MSFFFSFPLRFVIMACFLIYAFPTLYILTLLICVFPSICAFHCYVFLIFLFSPVLVVSFLNLLLFLFYCIYIFFSPLLTFVMSFEVSNLCTFLIIKLSLFTFFLFIYLISLRLFDFQILVLLTYIFNY